MHPYKVNGYVSKPNYSIRTIPISGLHGDNLIELSPNSPWYIGQGKGKVEDGEASKTLLEAIDFSPASFQRGTEG